MLCIFHWEESWRIIIVLGAGAKKGRRRVLLPPPISADPTRYHLSLSLSESNEKAVNKKKHIEMASDGGAGPSQVIRVRPNMEDGHGDKIVKSTRSFQSTKCKIMK